MIMHGIPFHFSMLSSGCCSGRIATPTVRLWLIAAVHIVILCVCFMYYCLNAMGIINDQSFKGRFGSYEDSDIADHMRGNERFNHQNGFNKTARLPRLFVSPFGKLGNNMFQAAVVVALARETGHLPTLHPTFEPLLQCFPNLHIQFGVASPNCSVVAEAAFAKFSHSRNQKIGKNDTTICCFLQSWKYFFRLFQRNKGNVYISSQNSSVG